uniref:Uncharacterized protein n=1 Tax=Anguilla anguilla TaxID=7936 RepID=A0A0E9RT21_ANGAN
MCVLLHLMLFYCPKAFLKAWYGIAFHTIHM